MKHAFAILAALPLCAGTQAAAQTRAPFVSVTEIPRDCPLTISFGSYAMGIDTGTFAKVSALLSRDRGVRTVEQRRWGREGEVTLCAKTRSRADARRLFARVRALFPARPRGPLNVSLANGIRFASPAH